MGIRPPHLQLLDRFGTTIPDDSQTALPDACHSGILERYQSLRIVLNVQVTTS